MNITWLSFLPFATHNQTQEIEIDKLKTQRWILGIIIGAAPFLVIVICWVFVSIFTNNFLGYCQFLKRKRYYRKRNNTNNIISQMSSL